MANVVYEGRAARATVVRARIHHEVVNDELATSIEKIKQARFAI
jgi:hypothetical protein